MPYCPDCEYEYESGTTVCPDCGARLIEGTMPPIEHDDNVDAVLLLETDNVLQAEFLAGALEEQGIPYVARGLGVTDGLGGSAGMDVKQGAFSSPGPKRIWVNPTDYDHAKELLESLDGIELDEGEEMDEGKGL